MEELCRVVMVGTEQFFREYCGTKATFDYNC